MLYHLMKIMPQYASSHRFHHEIEVREGNAMLYNEREWSGVQGTLRQDREDREDREYREDREDR